ncbi:hypothetical protein L1D54_15020 [Vibrio brasiliensis]|uniref:hypothetical protein n=1 Tax=Vibrio brasiliensis TaxID=170652 RepID=UPI001EFE31B3|nr:hypothetical protein [Vibrio brasiliensis]MCG9751797.1 hypothetical protein [Vibrio brasiliensis]
MLRSDTLTQPPIKGEKVMLRKREALFLPDFDPSIVQEMPACVRQFVLKQTPVYMDIGCADIDHNVNGAFLACFYTMLFVFAVAAFNTPDLVIRNYFALLLSAMAVVILVGIMSYYVVRRRRRATVRFYRTTQRVAFKTSPKSPVVEIDWQAIVPYVKTRKLRGSVGLSHISLDVVALHLAWFDKESNKLHTFYDGEFGLLEMSVLDEWNLIQRYMNEDESNYTSQYNMVPSSATFKSKRENVWQHFVDNEHKRLFTINIRNMSESYLSIVIYYFFLMLGLWRLPYLFCDLYLAIAVKPFLPKETHCHDTESRGTSE